MIARTLRRMRRSERGSDGFTLLEVTIAVGILAVGLLGIAAMSLQAMQQGRRGKHTSEAATVAYSVLEELNRLNFAHVALTDTGGAWTPRLDITTPGLFPWSPNPAPTQGSVQINGAVTPSQTYLVEWRITDAAAPPSPPWPAGTLAKRKTIDVRVWWNEPNWQIRRVTISSVRYDDEPTEL